MVCNVHNQTNGYNGFGFGVADLEFKPIMVVNANGIIAFYAFLVVPFKVVKSTIMTAIVMAQSTDRNPPL